MGEGDGVGARWNEDTERGGGAKNVRKEKNRGEEAVVSYSGSSSTRLGWRQGGAWWCVGEECI